MKYRLLLLLIMNWFLAGSALAVKTMEDPYKVTYLDHKKLKDLSWQEYLRNSASWKQFLQSHPGWWVDFDECSAMPHRAFGTPVATNTMDAASAAGNFLAADLKMFINNSVQLEKTGMTASGKYNQVNYRQMYNGMEVLFSRATVKLNRANQVVLFGLDVYNDIQPANKVLLSTADASQSALADFLSLKPSVQGAVTLKILPVQAYRQYIYKHVYELTVDARISNEPASYYTLVDAETGKILYRVNRVAHFTGGPSVNVSGTVYPSHIYNPSAVVPLPYLKVNTGIIQYTDFNGFLQLNSGTTSATITLEGLYGTVYTGQNGATVQSNTVSVSGGSNNVSMDPVSDLSHLSAYYHTNIVHDYMKSKLPTFTGMDFPIDIRVERTDGDCNAFYNGGINFYAQANGCNPLSMVNDVVYHEYGHGISYVFYNFNGSTFQNGALGEGYSDVWAMCITENPVLGIGFDDADPTVFIRNYDFPNNAMRKVYPQNLVGEVHSDGEIICGAWWDLALNLGSVTAMSDLFAEALYALPNGPDGAEGQLYTDILIDALMADDTDGNLMNGTPNASAITSAFALHGITLISNATLTHAQVKSSPSNVPVAINADLTNMTMQFAWAFSGVKCNYAINNSTSWITLPMTTVNGTNYTVDIPAQPAGTIIKYFIYVEDTFGTKSSVQPMGADASDPNIPYFIKVDMNQVYYDDFDVNTGNWMPGAPGDLATTGIWDWGTPVVSLINTNTIVQPSTQVTPGGSICYFTGNATAGAGAGTNDVDGGATTLELQALDLSGYLNPCIEYYRWYTNDQGATPGTDFWKVYISSDGVNFIPVENTKVADHSWRNFVFRVSDYITPSSTVYVRFVAEDANDGSLVEALIDDFSVFDQATVNISNPLPEAFTLYPNPANDKMLIKSSAGNDLRVEVLSATGQLCGTWQLNNGNGIIPVSQLSEGIYIIRSVSDKVSSVKRFVVKH